MAPSAPQLPPYSIIPIQQQNIELNDNSSSVDNSSFYLKRLSEQIATPRSVSSTNSETTKNCIYLNH